MVLLARRQLVDTNHRGIIASSLSRFIFVHQQVSCRNDLLLICCLACLPGDRFGGTQIIDDRYVTASQHTELLNGG